MQTFMPFPDIVRSVEVLDRQRLGKQRVETLQIMKALVTGQGWVHHPVTQMWEGYEEGLLAYQEATVNEWVSRGYQDTCLEKTWDLFYRHIPRRGYEPVMPLWFGVQEFHKAHQSNLLRKNFEHYKQFFPPWVPDDLPYIYPTRRHSGE